LKRPLRVLGDPSDREPAEPAVAQLGDRIVSIADAHDGAAARRFAEELEDAGATIVEGGAATRIDVRIVIRSTPQSPEARASAEVLEETADVVLGSPRPAFARLLGIRLLG
jgi:hypothetical protein